MRAMSISNFAELKYGQTYEVEDASNDPIQSSHKNGPIYWVVDLEAWYYQHRFIPLSDIDEIELVNTKEEVCI